jgi:hypothetical protein
MGQSGKLVGRHYLKILYNYLEHTPRLPTSPDGAINITKIAEQSGIPRQSFYKNPSIKAVLEEAKKAQGFFDSPVSNPSSAASSRQVEAATKPLSIEKVTVLERRISRLEQQNAALVAENAELRRQLKAIRLQLGREDMAIETGRRIPTPPHHE